MDFNTLTNQLRNAINEFLNHKDFSKEGNIAFKRKQKQLISFSKEVQCLPICIHILSEQTDQRINYFASMLLKDKLKYDFYQLDDSSVSETYRMLVNLIKKIQKPSKILLTNVVLCLAYLYIHEIQRVGTIVNFFKGIFAECGQGNAKMLYFLKFLELVPQEISNTRLVIDQDSRTQAFTILQNQQQQILQQMHNLSSNPSSFSFTEYDILLNAFSSWLQLNSTNEAIKYSLTNHNLMNLAFKQLPDEILFSSAASCIMTAVEMIEIPSQNQQLFGYISENLLGMLPIFDQHLKECNFEVVEEYVKILCQYGSNCAPTLIVHYNDATKSLIQHMLMYTQTEELQIFESLVDFWECLIDAMMKYSQNSALDKNSIHQILGRLITIILGKIKYSWGEIEHLNEISEKNLMDLHQKAQEISKRREHAGYLFYVISKNLGKQVYVREILNMIAALDTTNLQDYWSKLQAIIASLRDVVEDYPAPNPQICQIVVLYEHLVSPPIMVRRSFCRTFHQLFTMKQKSQEFIFKVLEHVTNMLDIPLLADRAQKAFNKCCRQNAVVLSKHLETIYKLQLKYPKKTGILSGMAEIIKISPQMAMNTLPTLLNSQVEAMNMVLAQKQIKKSAQKKQILLIFEYIFSLLKSGSKIQAEESYQNLIEQFFKGIWPSLQNIISNPYKRESDEDRTIQQVVKLLKIIIRTIPDRYLNYLMPVSDTICKVFSNYPISSFVYYFELILTQYRNYQNNELTNYLQQFFKVVCMTTYKHVNNFGGPSNLCILADDFLGLSKRIITYNKIDFLIKSQQLASIFDLAVKCLEASHPQLASSSSQFFQIVFMIYWTKYSRNKYKEREIGEVVHYDQNSIPVYNELKNYLLPSVSILITDLFKCLEKVPSETAAENILDCLNAIALAFPNQSQVLWGNPLGSLEIDILTSKQKEKLKQNLKLLGSNNPSQFLSSQQRVKGLLFLISKRYGYRANRQNLGNFK